MQQSTRQYKLYVQQTELKTHLILGGKKKDKEIFAHS
jgi:hypothetical protein